MNKNLDRFYYEDSGRNFTIVDREKEGSNAIAWAIDRKLAEKITDTLNEKQ